MEPDVARQRDSRRLRRPVWLAALAIAVLVVVLLAYGIAAKPSLPPRQGSPAPDFQLATADGSVIALSSYQGQVVVLNFFASWCAPCREEAADLQQAWQHYSPGQVQFLGIAYRDAASKARAFFDEFHVTYPFAADPGSRTARAYGVTGVPETFVVDQAGRLAHHYVGPVSYEQLSAEIDRLLKP